MRIVLTLLAVAIVGSGCIGTREPAVVEEVEPPKVHFTVAELKAGIRDRSVHFQQQLMVQVVAKRPAGETLVIFEEGIAANIIDLSQTGKIRAGDELNVAGFYSGYIKIDQERYIYIKDAALLPATITLPDGESPEGDGEEDAKGDQAEDNGTADTSSEPADGEDANPASEIPMLPDAITPLPPE